MDGRPREHNGNSTEFKFVFSSCPGVVARTTDLVMSNLQDENPKSGELTDLRSNCRKWGHNVPSCWRFRKKANTASLSSHFGSFKFQFCLCTAHEWICTLFAGSTLGATQSAAEESMGHSYSQTTSRESTVCCAKDRRQRGKAKGHQVLQCRSPFHAEVFGRSKPTLAKTDFGQS